MRSFAVPLAFVLVVAISSGCGLRRALIDRVGPPATATPSWVGAVRVEGTPIDSYLSKIAEVDERSGRPLSRQVFLSEAPGGGSDRNGVVVQPGESVLLVAAYGESPNRFYAIRSFDGLRRGWLPESSLAPQSRPR